MVGFLIGLGSTLVGAILIILMMWKKAPQDKAMVITGLKRRVITGKGGVVIPIFEQVDKISLENMKVEVKTMDSLDSNGVPLSTDGVAIVKVKNSEEAILSAIEQFNTGRERETIDSIKATVQDILEGKLREIISKMSIEQIYKDRELFANQVEEVTKGDLERMGLEIKTFTIRDIDDNQGYLKALGARQIAEVKKDAAIAEAEAQREIMQKTAEANRIGQESKLVADTAIAEAMKEKELKVQFFKEQEQKSKAKADFAYEIEQKIVAKQIIEAKKDAELLEEQKQTEIAMQQAIKKEKELEATVRKVAEAERYKQQEASDAHRYNLIKQAEAEATAIKIKGEAEAEIFEKIGKAKAEAMKAEAEAMKEKAEAYKEYGEAAMVSILAEKLPEVAKAISQPLAQTEKMVIIDNGGQGGAARVGQNVANMIAEVPEVVKSLTGVDLIDMVKGLADSRKLKNADLSKIMNQLSEEQINSVKEMISPENNN